MRFPMQRTRAMNGRDARPDLHTHKKRRPRCTAKCAELSGQSGCARAALGSCVRGRTAESLNMEVGAAWAARTRRGVVTRSVSSLLAPVQSRMRGRQTLCRHCRAPTSRCYRVGAFINVLIAAQRSKFGRGWGGPPRWNVRVTGVESGSGVATGRCAVRAARRTARIAQSRWSR